MGKGVVKWQSVKKLNSSSGDYNKQGNEVNEKKIMHDIEINKKEMLLKRTRPGRLAAKRMGKLGGRPKKLTPEKIELARKLYDDPGNRVEAICETLGISKPSFYAYIHDRHSKS